MREIPVVPQCNLIQACEWALYGWYPVSTIEERYGPQRHREKNCEENLEYHRAAKTLWDALQQNVLKLYKKNDNEGLFLNEFVGHNGETFNKLVASITLESATDCFDTLIYIMNSWTETNLYFNTQKICEHIPRGKFERYNIQTYRLELTDNYDIILHKPDTTTLLLKHLSNSSFNRRFIKFLFDHPNEAHFIKNISDDLHFNNGFERPDHIISNLKKDMKRTIEEQLIDQLTKEKERNIINNAFVYNRGQIKFIPINTPEN